MNGLGVRACLDRQVLADVVPHTASLFARSIIMPNLTPPVIDTELALAYRERTLSQVPEVSARLAADLGLAPSSRRPSASHSLSPAHSLTLGFSLGPRGASLSHS